MSADILLLALVDGLSYAGLLFLVALGLTLIFGVMGILNVAHGALYAFGGYAAATFVGWLAERIRTSRRRQLMAVRRIRRKDPQR
jgi:branched-chain amino acid transport system permease protein